MYGIRETFKKKRYSMRKEGGKERRKEGKREGRKEGRKEGKKEGKERERENRGDLCVEFYEGHVGLGYKTVFSLLYDLTARNYLQRTRRGSVQ